MLFYFKNLPLTLGASTSGDLGVALIASNPL